MGMPCVVLCFGLHQPLRLRPYSAFDTEADYFDDALNAAVLRRAADRCYRPGLKLLAQLLRHHQGRFRLSLGVSGVLLDQLRQHAPDLLQTLTELGSLDGVEFLNETYHHSLSLLLSQEEFDQQVRQHAQAIEELTGQRPKAFCNTELIYDNRLASALARKRRYTAVLVEGTDRDLDGRTVHQLYRPPRISKPVLIPRHSGLSDDISFRFADRSWSQWPLTPQKYAHFITRTAGLGPICAVCLDFETFGEHLPAETGIFDFLRDLPAAVLGASHENSFLTASQAAVAFPPVQTLDIVQTTSWADAQRDTSAWLGNAMQQHAAQELYALERGVKAAKDPNLLQDWKRLTCADHLYNMGTKPRPGGVTPNRANPYDSPYDAYIHFMNVLENLKRRAGSMERGAGSMEHGAGSRKRRAGSRE